MFPVSITAAKLSVLFFYHRIFPSKGFLFISIIIGIVTIAWFIVFIFLQFFTCVPLDYYWDKSIPGGHCIDDHIIAFYGTSPGDIATNIAILILPIPYLWNLQMHWQRKVAVIAIFLLGSLYDSTITKPNRCQLTELCVSATVGSIVRIPLLAKLNSKDPTRKATYLPPHLRIALLIDFLNTTDSAINSAIWLDVEVDIGILSASLPMLRPLFSKAFPSGFRSRFSRSRNVRYGIGSERLEDLEKEENTGRSSTLVGSNGGDHNKSVYSGGGNNHNTWYARGGGHNDQGSEGSQEEMVPIGRIAVRHDVDWDTKDGGSAAIPPA